MRNSILFALTWCLLLPICSSQENKSLLSVEEGDGGSGDPVIKEIQNVNYRVSPDDTEASGDDGDDTDIDVISGDGSGNDDGSGSGNGTVGPSYKPYIPVKTTATVDIINEPERNGTTTKRTKTTKERSTSKRKDDSVVTTLGDIVVEKGNSVQPSDNETVVITPSEVDDPLPSTGEDNSGVNFTVAIIVGVVVGAVLSILIIVFLVYRLRKKDEGSYSLDEPSSAMLRNDTDSPPPKGK